MASGWEKELQEAERAWREGNDGRARACCRRAVGVLLKAVEQNQNAVAKNFTPNAMERLGQLSANPDIPEPVRQAARRLTMNIRYRLSPDFTFNPILDAKKIIEYFLTK